MKNITYLLLFFVLTLLTGACEMQANDAGQAREDIPECIPRNSFEILPPDSKLDAVPENICVKRNTLITVHTVGHNQGMVSTTPQNSEDQWLNGSNAKDKMKFYLYVNGEVKNGVYKYVITTQSGAVKDPRVTVIND